VDGTYYGFYSVSETWDEQLLRRELPDDRHGNLYEGNVSDFTPGETDTFQVDETDERAPVTADIEEVTNALAAAPDDQWFTTLSSYFDIDELTTFWAVETTIGNPDGYTMFGNNYMAYHGKDAWMMFPWGSDQAFEWAIPVHEWSKYGGDLIRRCGEDADCAALMDEKWAAVVAEWRTGALAAEAKATADLVRPECAGDPRKDVPCDQDKALTFIGIRADSMDGW
jgi:spore coat protein CotH